MSRKSGSAVVYEELSLPCCGTVVQELSGDVSESSKNLQQDVWLALKARKESLEAQLKHKLDKLKELCLKEAVSLTIPATVDSI